jgi:regulator of nonsense transcripts 1
LIFPRRQVSLHEESLLGEAQLECYNCGACNLFLLGFVPAKADSVVVVLCRVCVETVGALKEMGWDLAEWLPLIQDRRLLPWLVKARVAPAVFSAHARTGHTHACLVRSLSTD